MLNNNFAYKLLALGCALVIWAYAKQNPDVLPRPEVSQTSVSRELVLPLMASKVESGCIVVTKPDTIGVRIEGRKEYVEALAAEPDIITAYVNCRDRVEGTYRLPVIIKLPEGYTDFLTAVPHPGEVLITTKNQGSREFPVNATLTGGKPEISPEKVIVRGAPHDLYLVNRVVAVLDAKSSTAASIDGDFPVAAQDSNGRTVNGLYISPRTVHLKFSSLESAKRTIDIKPKMIGQPSLPGRITSVEISPQTVTITGPSELLKSLNTLDTEPIRLYNRTRSFSQQVKIITPAKVSVVDATPAHLTVTITQDPSQQSDTIKGSQSENKR